MPETPSPAARQASDSLTDRRRELLADYYKTLQVTRDAEPEVIERAYKALSRSHHPDRHPASQREAATRRMQRINEAYAVLRDPKRRADYDRTLPPESGHAWDVFWERGLVGMFSERFGGSRGN